MKKVSSLVIGVAAVLILAATPLMGCEGEVSFTTASLSEATMTTAVDENMQPLDTTDVFAPDAQEIFCSVKLSSAPPDTEIKAEWVYIQGEVEDLTNYLIDEWSTTADGTRYIGASIIRPYDGWPKGDYKVVLYVDSEEELSVPFYVRQGKLRSSISQWLSPDSRACSSMWYY